MTQAARKWTFTGLRVVVCVVALAYVLDGVTWRDYVTLEDGRRLCLVEIDGEANTVTVEETHGGRTTLSSGTIATDEQGAPRIEFGLRTAWHKSRKSLLLLAVAVFAPVTILQSLRFLLVFRTQGIVLSYWECVKLCFSGNFLNFATPVGSTAGDVFKAYHVARHTEYKTEALTIILLDRFIGLGVLLLLVGIAIEVGARDAYLRYVGHVINAAIVMAVILAVLFFSERIRDRWLPRGLVSRLPLEHQLRRVDAATRRLLQHIPCFGGSILCTLMLQFLALSSFVVAAYALQMSFEDSKVFDYYACIGSGVVVAAIPISPQGLGTSEAVYRQFMLGSHGTLSQILCMAMAVRLIGLFWSLPGSLVALTGAYKLAPAEKSEQTT